MYIKVCNLHKTLLETAEDEMVAVLEGARANSNVSPILLGVCVIVCVCVHACSSIHTTTQTHKDTNAQTHTNTHVHTQTHTHTHVGKVQKAAENLITAASTAEAQAHTALSESMVKAREFATDLQVEYIYLYIRNIYVYIYGIYMHMYIFGIYMYIYIYIYVYI
jgi:hypothetical protein